MEHQSHLDHGHVHGDSCGHVAVRHAEHVDYLHDGHLHSAHGDHFDEHVLAVSTDHPAGCAPHACASHEATHRHGTGCGHNPVPHGDHLDYFVDSHLHHQHGEHCDDHGVLALVS